MENEQFEKLLKAVESGKQETAGKAKPKNARAALEKDILQGFQEDLNQQERE